MLLKLEGPKLPKLFRGLFYLKCEGPIPTLVAAAARVQRVHLHPSISSNGCIAPVLMRNCAISGPFSVQKGASSV